MSSLFSSSPTVVQAPTPTPPATMPDSNSPATLEARRKAIADANRSGRSATVLTTAAARAGGTLAGQAGGTYGGTKTGTS